MTARRRLWIVAAAATAIGLVARLVFRIDYLEEVDSIRFVLAVESFDVTIHRPHFPGYPVFIALGKAFHVLVGDPVVALGIVCAVSGATLALPVGVLTGRLFGPRAGGVAAVLVAVNPFLWLYSEKLLSDMPGLLFLFSALALLATTPDSRDGRRRPGAWAAFFLLGLTMGVRLSYFPFVLSGLILLRIHRRPLRGPMLAGLLGVGVWAIPLLLLTGWGPLVDVAMLQGGGHFTRWGGSLLTHGDPWLRLSMLTWEIGPQGLALWWADRSLLTLVPTVALAVVLTIALWRTPERTPERAPGWTMVILTTPYLLWAFTCQNITVKPRHALPLVVLALVLVAAAVARGTTSRSYRLPAVRVLATVAAAIMVVAHAWVGLGLVHQHQAVPSNAVRLAKEVAGLCTESAPAKSCVVYTASLQRHLERHAGGVTVVRLRRLAQVERDLAGRGPDTVAFVTSDVARLDRLTTAPIRSYARSRYVQNARNKLALYRIGAVPNWR